MDLRAGDRASAPAAYVRALDLSVERLGQDYIRTADEGGHQRYDYAAPGFSFACRLVYDESGLILELVTTDIEQLRCMIEDLRRLRNSCEPKSNQNPLYLRYSNAISALLWIISDLQAEGTEGR